MSQSKISVIPANAINNLNGVSEETKVEISNMAGNNNVVVIIQQSAPVNNGTMSTHLAEDRKPKSKSTCSWGGHFADE